QNKNVKTIAKRTGDVEGEYRIKKVKVILGENTTETIHKENNVRIKIDINKAYYSPRLQTERQRIMEQVKKGEIIIDMFAGVGPYTIAIAKKVKHIYALDHNADAIKLLEENIKLNKITNVTALTGDSLKIIDTLPKAHRIIMNAPRQNNKETLKKAMSKIRKNGIIHYYTTTENEKPKVTGLRKIRERRVIDYSPGKQHICIEYKKN
ncbi:MAG TPA: methyltransferase, partial [Candidatus Nanoarchaeia archaeon]|nr:methyltransferase [Candidatus Nanoarchaeia archaeon]